MMLVRTALLWLCLGVNLFASDLPVDFVRLGPFGGDVRSLLSLPGDPEIVFLGTADGQLFRSGDAGESWSRVVPGLERRGLVLDRLIADPSDGRVLYAAGWELKNDRGALYRSLDAGQTWTELSLQPFDTSVRAIAVPPSDSRTIAVGISEGVLVSRDGGKSWDRINRGYRSLHNVHSLAFDPSDAETLYVGTWRLAWKTPDLGKTWEPIHEGMYWDSDLFTLLVDPSQPSTLYAGACSGVYKSSNHGHLWRKLKNGLPDSAKRTRTLRFDSDDPSILYAGTTEGLYLSEDAGRSWRLILSDVVVNAVELLRHDPVQILVGTDDAGVYKSEDGGRSFRLSNRGFSQRQVTAVLTAGDNIYAGVSGDGRHGGVFVSSDGGDSWHVLNHGFEQVVGDIHKLRASGEGRLLMATSAGLFEGSEGDVWRRFETTQNLFIHDLDWLDPSERQLILAAREGLFLLEVGTERLQKLEIPIYDREFNSVFLNRGSGALFVGTEMGIFRSDDGGKSWVIKVKGLPYTSVGQLTRIGERLFAATRRGLFWSDSEGEEWNSAEGVFPIEISAVQSGFRPGGWLFAADSVAGFLFSSRDRGLSWQADEVSHSLSTISSLTIGPDGSLLAGTASEGVFLIRAIDGSAASGGRAESPEQK